MISQKKADEIAREWIEAWNAHDLERIIEHHSEKVVLPSPFVVKLLGDPSGTVRGKERPRTYFAKGLAAYPDLKFELFEVLTGVESLEVSYRSVKSTPAAEVMYLDKRGKIERMMAHYHT